MFKNVPFFLEKGMCYEVDLGIITNWPPADLAMNLAILGQAVDCSGNHLQQGGLKKIWSTMDSLYKLTLPQPQPCHSNLVQPWHSINCHNLATNLPQPWQPCLPQPCHSLAKLATSLATTMPQPCHNLATTLPQPRHSLATTWYYLAHLIAGHAIYMYM